MTISLMESVVEEAALDWFRSLGYHYLPGPDIACDGIHPERAGYADVLLVQRLRAGLASLPKKTDAASMRRHRYSFHTW